MKRNRIAKNIIWWALILPAFFARIPAQNIFGISKPNNPNAAFTSKTAFNPAAVTNFRLTNQPAESAMPDVAVDAAGLSYIVWQDNRDGNFEVYYCQVNSAGQKLTPEIRVTNTAVSSTIPKIALDAAKNAHVVWKEGASIYYAKLNASGAVIISPLFLSGSNSDYPDVAVQPDGMVGACWQKQDGVNHLVLFRRIDSAGQFVGNEVIVNQDLLVLTRRPRIDADGLGNFYAVFKEHDPNRPGIRTFMALRKIKPDNSMDPLSNVGGTDNAQNPTVTIGNKIGYICYEDLAAGKWEIFRAGGGQFTEAIGNSSSLDISSEDSNDGLCYVCWEDDRDGAPEIYYGLFDNRVKTGGDTRVSDVGSKSENPAVAAGKDGLAYIVWQDLRDGNWEIYFAAMASPPPPPLPTTFTRLTTGMVATDRGKSFSSSWADYDNDGYLDLFITNWQQKNLLYHNNRDSSFTRITAGEIVNDVATSFAHSWGDYNNDGYLDLFVANRGENNFLYRNNGNGTFTKITTGAIVTDGGLSNACAWGDYNNDGYLDLFVSNDDNQNNFLYRNNGDSTFTKITIGVIVHDGGYSEGCVWGDYDNDGYLDLFVANWQQKNFLYHNNRDETFTPITTGEVINDLPSTGGSWGDYDRDGDLDLFVTNLGNNSLYANTGNGTFMKITTGVIVSDGGNSRSSTWGDYDNDGDLDLFVANGYPSGGNNFLYQNNGDGTFTRITTGAIVNDGGYSQGNSWGDYDNDGDLDLIVANGWDAITGNNFLYRNNGNKNSWIKVRCLGTVSNAAAIGAKVRVKAQINGVPRWQMQQIAAQTGNLGQNSLNAEFGLGDATVIDSIKIEWPSRIVQVLKNVVTNQILPVRETDIKAPSDLTALVQGYTANLEWRDNSSEEEGFKIERKVNANGTYSQIAIVAANVTAYTDAVLSVNRVYYYRVRAFNGSNHSNYSNEVSAQTPRPNYGTTVITHGFRLFGTKYPKWALTMATAIAERLGGGQVYGINDGIIDGPLFSIGTEGEKILILNWAMESDIPQVGYAEAAGDALAAVLIEGAINRIWSLQQLHFIGHSRGTIVNSEAIERLALYSNTVNMLPSNLAVDSTIHFTVLDAHPWDKKSGAHVGESITADDYKVNSAKIGHAVTCWQNVAYADNYWQKDFFSLNGLQNIIGCKNNFELSDKSKMDHSAVHAWYYGTINQSATNDGDDINIELDWYSGNERQTLGFNRSIAAGGGDITSLHTENTIAVFDDGTLVQGQIFNGNFNFSNADKLIPGWDFQGGGGNGFADINFDWFNPSLRLDFGNQGKRHNKFYIPMNAEKIWYRIRVANKSDDDIFEVRIDNQLIHAQSVKKRQASTSYLWQSISVLPYFRGTTRTLEFKIRDGGSFGTVNSTVLIDDVWFDRKEYISAIVASPVYLHAYDSQGHHTGPISDSTWVTEIPGSEYYPERDSLSKTRQTIILPKAPVGVEYSFRIESKKATGSFSFQIEDVTGSSQTISAFFDSVAILPKTVAKFDMKTLSSNSELELDVDGNGVFEKKMSPTRFVQDFIIIATAGANGGISPKDTSFVLYGDSLKFAITPNRGYEIADVIVDNQSVVSVAFYTFRNTKANHTIHAKFRGTTGVDDNRIVPIEFQFSQNYPNPFNPATTIEFALPQRSHVTIRIFNLAGAEIRTLINASKEPGYHKLTWDGKDAAGQTVPSGVYLYKMQAGEFVAIKKSVLIR